VENKLRSFNISYIPQTMGKAVDAVKSQGNFLRGIYLYYEVNERMCIGY
jgi:hypothetical protein